MKRSMREPSLIEARIDATRERQSTQRRGVERAENRSVFVRANRVDCAVPFMDDNRDRSWKKMNWLRLVFYIGFTRMLVCAAADRAAAQDRDAFLAKRTA